MRQLFLSIILISKSDSKKTKLQHSQTADRGLGNNLKGMLTVSLICYLFSDVISRHSDHAKYDNFEPKSLVVTTHDCPSAILYMHYR